MLNNKKMQTLDHNYSKRRKFSSMTNIHNQKVNMVNLVNFGNVVLPNDKKKITLCSKPIK